MARMSPSTNRCSAILHSHRSDTCTLPALNKDDGVAHSIRNVWDTLSVSMLAHDEVDAIRVHECLGNGCFDRTPIAQRDTDDSSTLIEHGASTVARLHGSRDLH